MPLAAGARHPDLLSTQLHFHPPPRLRDYRATWARFSWEEARNHLDWLPGGALNIAHEAVDRHLKARGEGTALRSIARSGRRRDVSYEELAQLTSRFADALSQLGLGTGARVASLLGQGPEHVVAALGTLKLGAVFVPLSPSQGQASLAAQLALGRASALVTTPAHYEALVRPRRASLPALERVLLVRGPNDAAPPEGTLDLAALLESASPRRRCLPTRPDDPAFLHFTRGTTGAPKATLHSHRSVLHHHVAGAFALDLHSSDVLWCTADVASMAGTGAGLVAPLSHGATVLLDESELDAQRFVHVVEEQRVTIAALTPAVVRELMAHDEERPPLAETSCLRFVSSVGEPLEPEAVLWSVRALGHPIHDGWGQTETGGVMIANYRGMPVRPGSMGKPLPGVDVALVVRRDDGSVVPFTTPGVTGELALRPGWPAMFMGYLDDEPATRRCFDDGWYFTGDLAQVDADGYFWFVGRADDDQALAAEPRRSTGERKAKEQRPLAAVAEASP